MANTRKRLPAATPEQREAILTSLAWDRAEEMLRNGTASSQIITTFAKAGFENERLKVEQLKAENDLLRAKIESLEIASRNASSYEEVEKALKRYQGSGSQEVTDEDFY